MSLLDRETPLPPEILDWQVRLRAWTVEKRRGAPHSGVVPLVLVAQPGIAPGFTAHSIVCGLLPRRDRLDQRTRELREIYESGIYDGAKSVFDRGLAYLRNYYRSPEDFDPASITALVPAGCELVRALRAEPLCALVFHVFEVGTDAPGGAMRTQQLSMRAEVLGSGPVFDNVWFHHALFHGSADEHVVLCFRHRHSYDVRFGRLEPLAA